MKDDVAYISTNPIECHLSFLIASKRPYDLYARKTVDSIVECINFSSSKKISYEIIVCHKDPVLDSRVKWIKDPVCDGGNSAFNLAYSVSSGQYACVLVDDGILIGDIGGVLDLFENEIMEKRKFKIVTIAGGISNMATSLSVNPDYKEYLKHIDADTDEFTSLVVPFPIVSRKTIDTLMGGCIFRPDIKVIGDMFLGMYLQIVQEPVIQYNKAKIYINSGNEDERTPDPVTRVPREKHFTESYVNTYKLLSHYLRKAVVKNGKAEAMSYLWKPEQFKYETTEDVVNFYRDKRLT
jgi:hypothetical protein